MRFTLTTILIALMCSMLPLQAQCPATPNIFQTSLLEAGQPGAEITTERLQQILAAGSPPVLDVRFPQEYAISHIPGAINIPPTSNTDVTSEVADITSRYPDRHTELVLTCNGPFCGKSKRVAAVRHPTTMTISSVISLAFLCGERWETPSRPTSPASLTSSTTIATPSLLMLARRRISPLTPSPAPSMSSPVKQPLPMTTVVCRCSIKEHASWSLPAIPNWQRKSPPRSRRRLTGAVATSAEHSRICRIVVRSTFTAGAGAMMRTGTHNMRIGMTKMAKDNH